MKELKEGKAELEEDDIDDADYVFLNEDDLEFLDLSQLDSGISELDYEAIAAIELLASAKDGNIADLPEEAKKALTKHLQEVKNIIPLCQKKAIEFLDNTIDDPACEQGWSYPGLYQNWRENLKNLHGRLK